MSLYPLNPTPNRVRNLESYIAHAEDAATKAQTAAQTVNDQVAIATTQAGNALASAQAAAASVAGLTGSINSAVNTAVAGIKAVRVDQVQNFVATERLTAKRNIGTLGSGIAVVGGAASLDVSHVGKLIYTYGSGYTVLLPLLSSMNDGDFIDFMNVGQITISRHATDATANASIYLDGATVGSISSYQGENFRLTYYAAGPAWMAQRTVSANATLLADRAQNLNDAQKLQLLTNAGLLIPQGQCRLNYVSPTQVRLDPYNGNQLWINGAYRTLPAPGVTISNSGLAANSLYFLYANWAGSAVALVANPTGPLVDSIYGNKVYGGGGNDSSNRQFSLVGMVYTNASGQFQDTPGFRGVLSYHNRMRRDIQGADVTGTVGTSYTEVSSAGRAIILSWGEDAVHFGAMMQVTPGTYDNTFVWLTVDGAGYGRALQGTGGTNGSPVTFPYSPQATATLSIGVHNLSVSARTGGSSANVASQIVGSISG